ncbi:MAG: hypothetical protein RI947_601 [Candidatus Parcubacteria bacterium]|jgi:hypothetical protein
MNLLKYATTARKVKNDPFGFLIDTLTKVIVNLVVPIPLAGEIAALFKGPILGFLGSLLILALFMLIAVGTVFMSPLLVSSAFLKDLLALPVSTTHMPIGSFVQTSIPKQIPLGGKGLEYANITAGFKDPSYFLHFGKVHFGLDLVPNDSYYSSSQAYKDTHKVIINATHSGKITYYVDEYGSETVEIMNDDSSLKTIYMHMKEVYVSTGGTAQAGTPLGEMGKTGFATAEHIHYEIRVKNGTKWLAVNPLTYIQ